MKTGLITFLIFLLGPGMVLGQVQSIGNFGSVNWGNAAGPVITAKGIGAMNPNLPQAPQRPAAIRAAKLDALRNALETVKGVNISSNTTVRNFMVENDEIRTRVEGFVNNFKFEEKPHYMSDGTVEISVELPLSGIMMDALLPTSIAAAPAAMTWPGEPVQFAAKQAFTGLVVDARGLGILPAMAPRILDEENNEIYGSAYVSREFALKHGVVGYAKSVEQAQKIDRLGNSPGVIKAVKSGGENKTDIVISKGDADSIKSSSKDMKYLSECRVVFVVD